jgi:hypothetical protein
MSNAIVSGSCLCGAVRFKVRPPTAFCGHCHCSMCRRNHGAGFVTWISLPKEQFELETGSADLVVYPSSEHGKRSFCGRCGSSLACESTERPNDIDLPLASLDGPIDRAPEFHIHVDDRADWVVIDDDLPQLGGPTGLEPKTRGDASG